MTVTEVGCMGIKPSISLTDHATPDHALLTSIWKNIISLPNGPSRLYWGVQSAFSSATNSQDKLWAFFDWESVKEHEEFAATYGARAVQRLPELLTHGEFTKHIYPPPTSSFPFPSPSPSPSPSATGMTTMLLLSFPSDISPQRQDNLSATVKSAVTKHLSDTAGRNVNVAWGVETDFPVRRGKGGEVGALCVVFVGWADDGRGWEEWVAEMKGVEGLSGVEVVELECEMMGKEEVERGRYALIEDV